MVLCCGFGFGLGCATFGSFGILCVLGLRLRKCFASSVCFLGVRIENDSDCDCNTFRCKTIITQSLIHPGIKCKHQTGTSALALCCCGCAFLVSYKAIIQLCTSRRFQGAPQQQQQQHSSLTSDRFLGRLFAKGKHLGNLS